MLFNMLGRNNPSKNCRVFSDTPKEFYKSGPVDVDYAAQHSKAVANGIVSDNRSLSEVEDGLLDIGNAIKGSDDYRNLFNGLAIPFCFSMPKSHKDLGTQLEDFWLPLLKKDYENQVEGSYFKATLQGNTELKGSVGVSENSLFGPSRTHRPACLAGVARPNLAGSASTHPRHRIGCGSKAVDHWRAIEAAVLS